MTKVEYRYPNPKWAETAQRFANEFNPCHRLMTREEYVRDKMEATGIAPECVIIGRIVHCNYELFNCVILAEDGTYHKVGLDQVKVLEDITYEH